MKLAAGLVGDAKLRNRLEAEMGNEGRAANTNTSTGASTHLAPELTPAASTRTSTIAQAIVVHTQVLVGASTAGAAGAWTPPMLTSRK